MLVTGSSSSIRLSPRLVRTFANMGVDIQKISPGNGQYPKSGQTVSVHYTGTLQNGQEFDSSRKRGKPLDFKLGQGQVIRGWDEGIIQLSKGERAKLVISPDYAYGSKGAAGVRLSPSCFVIRPRKGQTDKHPLMLQVIPPNATLNFDVELVDFR